MKINNNPEHVVAIMAGGIGSRFWPQSRTSKPKQFLDVLHTGETLIQTTFNRFNKYIDTKNIYVITCNEYKTQVQEQLPNIPEENILCEPSRKNTAPCIAYITYKLNQKNPNTIITCAPADHLVLNENAFEEINKSAVDFAAHINAIVTIGIRPTFPHTGYGYIQHVDKEVAPGVFQVKLFTEKPDVELAQTFFDSGDFLWNAGLFTFKTQHMVTAFEKYLPELHDVFDSLKDVYNTANETAAIEKAYPQCTSISIDFGIMEKAKNVYVIPASFGWSDLGTWASAYENLEKDYLGNAVMGNNVVVYDSHNNIVKTLNDKLVVLQGLEDLIVVDTKDVLLICKKENEPDIKNYIADIKRNKGDKFL